MWNKDRKTTEHKFDKGDAFILAWCYSTALAFIVFMAINIMCFSPVVNYFFREQDFEFLFDVKIFLLIFFWIFSYLGVILFYKTKEEI